MPECRLVVPVTVAVLALWGNSRAVDPGSNSFPESRHAVRVPAAAFDVPISDTDFVYLYPNDIFQCCVVGPFRFEQAVVVDHSTPLTSLTIPIRLTGAHPDLRLDSSVFTPPGVPGVSFGPGGHDSLWDTRLVVVDDINQTVLFQFMSDVPVDPGASDTLCFIHWHIPDSFYLEVATWFIDTVTIAGEHLQIVGSTDTLIPTWSRATIQVNEIGIQNADVPRRATIPIDVQPNPFNSQARVQYTLLAPERVRLTIYSILGQRVRGWSSQLRSAGQHEWLWDGHDDKGRTVASGVYYFVLEGERNSSTSTGVMLK